MKASGALLVFLLVSILWIGLSQSQRKSDFSDYYRASQRMRQGHSLYKFDLARELSNTPIHNLMDWDTWQKVEELKKETGTYIYPPFFAFLLIPLTYLDYEDSAAIHSVFQWFCLVGAIFLLERSSFVIRENEVKHRLPLILSLIFSYKYLENHAQNNQVGFFLLFLIACIYCLKNDWIKGVCLGIAVIVKLSPILFLFWLFYERNYKAFVSFGITSILCLALPFVMDSSYALSSFQEWYVHVFQEALSNPAVRAWKNNQSLGATLSKLFFNFADPQNQFIYHLPLVSLELTSIKYIQGLFTIVFGVPLLYLGFQKNKSSEIFAMLCIVSCLWNGISWIHSFVVFLIPILYFWSRFSEFGNLRFLTIAILLLPLLFHRSILGTNTEGFLMMISFLFWTGIAFYIILLKRAYDIRD